MDVLRALPAPLSTRVTDDRIVVGVFLAPHAAQNAELARALQTQAPLPLRLILFGTDARPEQLAPPHLCEVCSIDAPDFPGILAKLEVACLPHSLLDSHQSLLAHLAVPTLIVLEDGTEHWSGAGLAAAAATPPELAALLLLLATDPPTRRRALDSQRALIGTTTPAKRWRVEGVFDSSYSLAIVNRRLALALDDTGEAGEAVALYTYEQGENPQPNFATLEDSVRIRAMWERSREPRPPSVALRNAWPPRVRDLRGERRVLANYAWEESGFPVEDAQDFNRVLDLITVVSTQTARFLQDAGVEVPIAVVGNGVDQILESAPEPLPRPLPDGFRFLHVSSCFPRKGADVLLAAFGQAFRDHHDVVLIIKTFPNPHNDIAEQLARLRAQDPHYPRVEIYQEDWTPGQIAGLYRACQTLVVPSRGEGFGLPIAEAMLHALPVIVTGWGGHLDYCDADTAWLIDYHLSPARTHLAVPDSLWAEPDTNHLSTRLRELYATPAEQLQPKLDAARTRVLERYTWSQVAQRTRHALARIDDQPGPLPPLKTGWISTWGSRCGIAAYSAHLTAAFASGTLAVFAPTNETLEHPDPAHVIRNWRKGEADLSAIVTEAQKRQLTAVVIQYHWGFFGLDALTQLITALHQQGIAVVIDLHNTRSAPPELSQPVHRRAWSACARLLAHTLDDVRRLQDWGFSANVTLFPLAVYPVPTPDPEQVRRARQALGLEGQTILATFGYLMPHKGLAELLEALPALIAAHPDLHLLMVNARYSATVSDPEIARLQARIAQLGLSGRVTFKTEYLPEAQAMALLSLADLVVFPYQHSEESSSAAVRMAISAGRPIAITPLTIFDDVAPATLSLPGITPEEMAAGLAELLRRLVEKPSRQAAIEQVRTYAAQHDAHRRSAQLAGLLTGLTRQLEMP